MRSSSGIPVIRGQGFSKIQGSHSRIHQIHPRNGETHLEIFGNSEIDAMTAVLGDADSVSLPDVTFVPRGTIPLHGWSKSEKILGNIAALDRMLRYAQMLQAIVG